MVVNGGIPIWKLSDYIEVTGELLALDELVQLYSLKSSAVPINGQNDHKESEFVDEFCSLRSLDYNT